MFMGREQKREIARKLRKKGLPREVAEAYAERLTSETRNPRYAWEGEKVKLDVLQLTSYKEWRSEGIGPHRKKYQDWVLAHAEDVFTVEYDPDKVERGAKDVKTLVQLKEDTTEPKWLFWAGDLIPEPGQKAPKYEADIIDYINSHHPIVIAVNFMPKKIPVKYVFISNRKRFASSDFKNINAQVIATSNLSSAAKNIIFVDYYSLCDSRFNQPDNAGMMALRLLLQLKTKNVVLAGFDGFSTSAEQNYYDEAISDHNTRQIAREKNADYASQLLDISNKLSIQFLTPSIYKKIIDSKK